MLDSGPNVIHFQSVGAHLDIEVFTSVGGHFDVTDTGTIPPGGTSLECLDDDDFNSANGTQMWIWDCNDGINQQWTLP